MSRRLPPLNALRAFEAAGRHERLRPAAAELHVTEGAISHQVRQLEAHFGQPLFRREKQRLALTPDGRRLLAVLTDCLDRMDEACRRLEQSARGTLLSVSVSPNFAARWLAPRLGRFAAAHPGIDLRISASPHRVFFQREGIDLAVRHGDGRWPDLVVTRLAEEQLFPVASPGYGTDLSLAALQPGQLLRSLGRDDWKLWLAAAGRPDLEPGGPAFDQDFMAIDAAVAGQGLAMARSALVAADLAAGRLRRPFPLALPAPFAYWIVYPLPYAERPVVQLFRDWLLAEAAADQAAVSSLAA